MSIDTFLAVLSALLAKDILVAIVVATVKTFNQFFELKRKKRGG